MSPSTATPGTALLTPEREQRRPDSQVREDHSNYVQIICVYFFSAAGGSYKHGDGEEHRSSFLWWSVRPHQQGRAAPVPGYCPWWHLKTDTGSATCQTKTQHKIKYLQVIVLQMQYLSLSINLHSENSSFIHYKSYITSHTHWENRRIIIYWVLVYLSKSRVLIILFHLMGNQV